MSRHPPATAMDGPSVAPAGTIAFFQRDGEGKMTEAVGSSNPFRGIALGGRASPAFHDLDADGIEARLRNERLWVALVPLAGAHMYYTRIVANDSRVGLRVGLCVGFCRVVLRRSL